MIVDLRSGGELGDLDVVVVEDLGHRVEDRVLEDVHVHLMVEALEIARVVLRACTVKHVDGGAVVEEGVALDPPGRAVAGA